MKESRHRAHCPPIRSFIVPVHLTLLPFFLLLILLALVPCGQRLVILGPTWSGGPSFSCSCPPGMPTYWTVS
eukprot:170952-Pyramimonas_sp.AAC.1